MKHFGFDLLPGEQERETKQAAKTVGKDLAKLVLKEASKFVSNRDLKKKLNAEGVPTIQLLEDVAKLVVDAAKLKEGVKETAKLILKEAIKEAAIVIVKESIELAVKEEAKHILNALEKRIDPEKKIDHHPTADSSKHHLEDINHWIDKFI